MTGMGEPQAAHQHRSTCVTRSGANWRCGGQSARVQNFFVGFPKEWKFHFLGVPLLLIIRAFHSAMRHPTSSISLPENCPGYSARGAWNRGLATVTSVGRFWFQSLRNRMVPFAGGLWWIFAI